MNQIRILYLIQVSWRHIFQRPHIIPLLLDRDYDCTVVQLLYYWDLSSPKQIAYPKKLKSIFQIPEHARIPFTTRISNRICAKYNKAKISRLALENDIIWICHPNRMQFVPENYDGLIVYDCMDDHSQLGSRSDIEATEKCEKQLIERADLIFASSSRLVEKIGCPEKTVLLRNGFSSADKSLPVKEPQKKDRYQIDYFGTVSEWFDFDLLEKSLPDAGNVSYKIIGPVNKKTVSRYESDSISFAGTVPHSELPDAVSDCDALIMPFKLNELVLAVDPVKLYEYINFGKPVISVRYPEIERFEPFVYFYSNQDEYVSLMKELSGKGFPPKYDENQRKTFLEENSWDSRYITIKKHLNAIVEGKTGNAER